MWFSPPNSIRLNPPKAAIVWSWDPTFSRIISCSMWIASRARRRFPTILPFSAYSA